jgi:hypothetical protein
MTSSDHISILSFDIGINNLAFCELAVPKDTPSNIVRTKIIKWEIISLREPKEKIDFDEMMKRLLVQLRARWPLPGTPCTSGSNPLPDRVLLENQPCMKNPTMKSIQVFIYAYFAMTGSEQLSPRLFSASNKLKVSRNTLLKTGQKQKTVSYGEKKKMAIAVTRLYVVDDWLTFFEKQKKKDDYSDCYLQAVYYIENS